MKIVITGRVDLDDCDDDGKLTAEAHERITLAVLGAGVDDVDVEDAP